MKATAILKLAVSLGSLVGLAAATDTCNTSNEGGCCAGYSYVSTPLLLRRATSICAGNTYPNAPTCGDGKHPPVCTSTISVPAGRTSTTLNCGNGAMSSIFDVKIQLCSGSTTEYCFHFDIKPPSGSSFDTAPKVEFSTAKVTETSPGRLHYTLGFGATGIVADIAVKDVFTYLGLAAPCTTSTSGIQLHIAFHTGVTGTTTGKHDTCWGGDIDIAGGVNGGGWAKELVFDLSCTTICTNWCCCPPPPEPPTCATTSTHCPKDPNAWDCPARCQIVEKKSLFNDSTYYKKCCCPTPETMTCTAPKTELVLEGGASCPTATRPECEEKVSANLDCAGNPKRVCCCGSTPPPPPPPPPADTYCDLGTAFAAPPTCPVSRTAACTTNAISATGCSKRWGWYVPAASGSSFTLYSGAGQNILGRAAVVGAATVGPCAADPARTCVRYRANDGFRLNSAHVDVSCGSALRAGVKACAPGQYNLNAGGSCPAGGKGLANPWESAPLPACGGTWTLILHATVSKKGTAGTGCTEGCGNSDTGSD
jgi:hypothetical protein